jgi:hypothetical protein
VGKRFIDKTVVITGASAGIGACASRQFAAEGANVVLAARGREALDAVAAELPPGRALVVPTDVGDTKALANLLARADEQFGAVHVVVNNAGYNLRGPVSKFEPDDLGKVVDVNLRAPIVMSRMALPYLRRAGRGAIVNVASIAGRLPLEDEATYSATKFGLRCFTFAMAEELAGSGITVSAVSPGPVETQFILGELDEVPDVVFSQPMRTPEQIAALILDCAHDGQVERTEPRVSGYLATLAYLVPGLRRRLKPLMEMRGRANKRRYRERTGER